MAFPVAAGGRALRFRATEPGFHWDLAVWYLGLLFSGLPLMLPGLRPWIYGWTRVVRARLHAVSPVLCVMASARRLPGTFRELSA